MNPRIVGALAVVGLGPSAGGQSPSFAYSFGVANPQLAPGQSTMVTVLCGFSPGFGGVVTAPGLPGSGVVLGLSTGAFGIAGTGGGWTLGAPPTGSLIAPYNFTGTNQGTAAGTGITGVLWGNGFPPPLGTVSSVNPTPLWHATFTAPGVAGVVILRLDPAGMHAVWAVSAGWEFPVEISSGAVTGAEARIRVVPAPAGLAVIGLAGLVCCRRRHRTAPMGRTAAAPGQGRRPECPRAPFSSGPFRPPSTPAGGLLDFHSVVPAPASLALLEAGVFAATRRRRGRP